MSSRCWWLKKRFLLSSRSGASVWTRAPPTLKRNRRTQSTPTLKRNSGPLRKESSFKGWRRLVSSSHSLL
ncbi:hypothetical protein EYF80_064509 [Liparis tanakae]|uniref:Uncharacterized protein n=1 Tax=Liparis tanakae TaxID=230148 RepID=A0A4Z2E9K0_9TELE|nr:hypothetical protein EYF80_064509 [Liparis tanakae]